MGHLNLLLSDRNTAGVADPRPSPPASPPSVKTSERKADPLPDIEDRFRRPEALVSKPARRIRLLPAENRQLAGRIRGRSVASSELRVTPAWADAASRPPLPGPIVPGVTPHDSPASSTEFAFTVPPESQSAVRELEDTPYSILIDADNDAIPELEPSDLIRHDFDSTSQLREPDQPHDVRRKLSSWLLRSSMARTRPASRISSASTNIGPSVSKRRECSTSHTAATTPRFMPSVGIRLTPFTADIHVGQARRANATPGKIPGRTTGRRSSGPSGRARTAPCPSMSRTVLDDPSRSHSTLTHAGRGGSIRRRNGPGRRSGRGPGRLKEPAMRQAPRPTRPARRTSGWD